MTKQNWTNIGGAEAFQLIERHAEDWADAGRMMEAWRDAQTARLNAEWMAKSDEEIMAMVRELGIVNADWVTFARAIIAAMAKKEGS